MQLPSLDGNYFQRLRAAGLTNLLWSIHSPSRAASNHLSPAALNRLTIRFLPFALETSELTRHRCEFICRPFICWPLFQF